MTADELGMARARAMEGENKATEETRQEKKINDWENENAESDKRMRRRKIAAT